MAIATIPSRGGDDLRVCEKVYWGRSLHKTSTTCKQECNQTLWEQQNVTAYPGLQPSVETWKDFCLHCYSTICLMLQSSLTTYQNYIHVMYCYIYETRGMPATV